MALGISYPFAPASGSDSYFASVNSVKDAIAQDAKSLLSTDWGERVMHPDFGCNLSEFIFEPQTQPTRQRISDRIVKQFGTWMPFVDVTGVAVAFSSDDTSLPGEAMRVQVRIVYGNVMIDVAQGVPQ